jgi:hypothetical protein
MAKRSRAVRPDLAYELDDGRVIGVVSEDALQAAVADAVTVAMWSGGMVSVALNRHPTGVPHEMVTVGALVVWQDRDDAKPQPEPASPAREVEPEPVEKVAEPVLEPDGTTGWDPTPEQLEAALEDEAMPATEELEEAVAVGVPVGVEVGAASYEQARRGAVAAEGRRGRRARRARGRGRCRSSAGRRSRPRGRRSICRRSCAGTRRVCRAVTLRRRRRGRRRGLTTGWMRRRCRTRTIPRSRRAADDGAARAARPLLVLDRAGRGVVPRRALVERFYFGPAGCGRGGKTLILYGVRVQFGGPTPWKVAAR